MKLAVIVCTVLSGYMLTARMFLCGISKCLGLRQSDGVTAGLYVGLPVFLK